MSCDEIEIEALEDIKIKNKSFVKIVYQKAMSKKEYPHLNRHERRRLFALNKRRRG